MRQKTIIDEVDEFAFNSDVDTDFEDSFPVEITDEVIWFSLLSYHFYINRNAICSYMHLGLKSCFYNK